MTSENTSSRLSVHHVAVVVADLERAERFYAEVLGLRVMRRWEDQAGRPRSIWFALQGNTFLAVERAEAAGPQRDDLAPGFHCLALGIRPDERAEWRDRFERAGVSVFRESAYTLYVRDPDGNIVGLSHFPNPAEGT